jgi:predicted nucleic acid-binding protein
MTVVDTDVLLDIFTADKVFGQKSMAIVRKTRGLIVCPITYIELSPAFSGKAKLQEEFLTLLGISWQEDFTWADYLKAHEIWNKFVLTKQASSRSGPNIHRRLPSDCLIEAFAIGRKGGLITRNVKDYKTIPASKLIQP